MAITKYFVKQGLVQKSKADILGGFNLNRFFKWMAEKLHIAYHDECCDEDVTARPVRLETETGELEYFNGEAWESVGVVGGGDDLLTGLFAPVAQDNIAAAAGGAISITTYTTTINTDAGGDAFTLADGSKVGQLKIIRLVTDGGGDGVVTPANLAGGTTITFNDAGDEVTLIWNGTDWVVIKNVGASVA